VVVLWSVVVCAVVLWSVAVLVESEVEDNPLDRPSEVADSPVCALSVDAAVGSVRVLVVAACELVPVASAVLEAPVLEAPVLEAPVPVVCELALGVLASVLEVLAPVVEVCVLEVRVGSAAVVVVVVCVPASVPPVAAEVVLEPVAAETPAVSLWEVVTVEPPPAPMSVVVLGATVVAVPPLVVEVEPSSALTLPAVCESCPEAEEPPRSAWGAFALVVGVLWPPLAVSWLVPVLGVLLVAVLGVLLIPVLGVAPPRSAVGAAELVEGVAAVCTPLFSDSVP
jgi:hypothetical protein